MLVPGQYIPGDSVLHRLTAAAKVFSAAFMAMAVPLADSWMELLIVSFAVCLGYFWAGLGWRVLASMVKPFLLFALLAVFFGDGGEGKALVMIGSWEYTTQDLLAGLSVAVRLLLLLSSVGWLAATTPPTELVAAVVWLMQPLRKIGLPINDLAVALMLSLRFLPIVGAEASRLTKAQAARGVGLVGGWQGTKRRLDSLVVPLFAGVFRRSDALAEALIMRGYRRGQNFFPVAPPRPGAGDFGIVAVAGCVPLLVALL